MTPDMNLRALVYVTLKIDTYQHRIQRLGRKGGGEGSRNMKSMRLPLAATFFYDLFLQSWVAMDPSAPPGSATTYLQLDVTSCIPSSQLKSVDISASVHIQNAETKDTQHKSIVKDRHKNGDGFKHILVNSYYCKPLMCSKRGNFGIDTLLHVILSKCITITYNFLNHHKQYYV